jgi:hypothetical protein
VITFDEKIVGVWFVATLPTQDWLAALRELEPDAKYELTYRFRYYKDDKPWDSEDKKNWYRGEVTGTRAYVIASIRAVVDTMVATGPKYEVMNDRGYAQFQRDFQDQPFVFAKMLSKEEAADMAREE